MIFIEGNLKTLFPKATSVAEKRISIAKRRAVGTQQQNN
jgi:hypothetical protein